MAEDRNLVLAPGSYAYVLDKTSGHVTVNVGPKQINLPPTSCTVVWDPVGQRFNESNQESAIQRNKIVPEGQYVVLSAPSSDKEKEHPKRETSEQPPTLFYGKQVNIPGPQTFALWPGQTAKVIPGHRMRSNQYVIVQVINSEEAKSNWDKESWDLVNAPQDLVQTSTDETAATAPPVAISSPEISNGLLIIVRGTDIPFFIPPTGTEVLPDENDDYVRDAVTLERLQYCILQDEDGNKVYAEGPKVVFPTPTQRFVLEEGSPKYQAIELNSNMGIHVKVIADYTGEDDDGVTRPIRTGEELFITGKTKSIYIPRPEHALITYGDQKAHFAITIPEGEGRYVLNKNNGEIRTVVGPFMLLADPRKEVIIRRVLTKEEASLLYPGNIEVDRINEKLRLQSQATAESYISVSNAVRDAETSMGSMRRHTAPLAKAGLSFSASGAGPVSAMYSNTMESFGTGGSGGSVPEAFRGDQISRKTSFTAPRQLTLDTKYDGAVSIRIYDGYAVQMVNKNGDRRVIVGPSTVILGYGETPQPFTVSTGKPKNTDNVRKDVYLQVKHNKISDIIEVETKDMCPVQIKLSYRVNFVGEDPSMWFKVDNYVKFMCDHLRSRLRNAMSRIGIEELHGKYVDTVRDTILGQINPQVQGRAGLKFEENQMHIYDVEVLSFKIMDREIEDLLTRTELNSVRRQLLEISETERVTHELAIQKLKQTEAEASRETSLKELENAEAIEMRKRESTASLLQQQIKLE